MLRFSALSLVFISPFVMSFHSALATSIEIGAVIGIVQFVHMQVRKDHNKDDSHFELERH